MFVTLEKLLKHPTFKDARVLAGRDGIGKQIQRVSVFDCPIPSDIYDVQIVEEGDFFISGLRQFEHAKESSHFIKLLHQLGSSGLCIAANHIDHLITEDILTYCNDNRFAIMQIDENIPYAYLMDTINRFISIDNLNAINELKLDKIMTTKLSDREKLSLLHSINSNVERYIQVICLSGTPRSELGEAELNEDYLNRREDIFVNSTRIKVLIASHTISKKLETHVSVVKQQLLDHYLDAQLGISRIHECYDIDKALDEARAAFEAARITGQKIHEYKPLSSMQLLISLRDSRELDEYYQSFIGKIKEKISDDGLHDILQTIKTYVLNQGDYKKTGEMVSQHENTVRYRINKVRTALEMEDDLISFHETISLIVKIQLLRDQNL